MEKGVLVVLTRFFQPIPIIPPVRLFESSMNLIRGVAALLPPRSLASSLFLISATRARGSTLDVVNREEIEVLHAFGMVSASRALRSVGTSESVQVSIHREVADPHLVYSQLAPLLSLL